MQRRRILARCCHSNTGPPLLTAHVLFDVVFKAGAGGWGITLVQRRDVNAKRVKQPCFSRLNVFVVTYQCHRIQCLPQEEKVEARIASTRSSCEFRKSKPPHRSGKHAKSNFESFQVWQELVLAGFATIQCQIATYQLRNAAVAVSN